MEERVVNSPIQQIRHIQSELIEVVNLFARYQESADLEVQKRNILAAIESAERAVWQTKALAEIVGVSAEDIGR